MFGLIELEGLQWNQIYTTKILSLPKLYKKIKIIMVILTNILRTLDND